MALTLSQVFHRRGMAWRAPATPSRGSHKHPHSARQLRRRTLHTPLLPYTNYPYTQALSVLTLKAPAGHSWPPSSTWYHHAGSPPPWTGTADRDLCSHAGTYALACIGFRDPRRLLGQRLAEACSNASLCSSYPLAAVDGRDSQSQGVCSPRLWAAARRSL